MIPRIGRLTRVELLKLFAHPFFYVSLVLLLGATSLAAWAVAARPPTAWRPPATVEIFAAGAKWGLRLASYVLLIFGAMLFAGEFDRGTIKILLTRPVRRSEVFLAKCLTGGILAVLLAGAVLGVAWAEGCLWGELGPVWDAEHYVSPLSEDQLQGHLARALATGLPALAAFCFAGILLSNLVESSGFAVALALIATFAVDAATSVFSGWGPWWSGFYPSYAFETLQQFAGGYVRRWRPEIHARHLPLLVPLATVAGCAAAGYAVFRSRNVIA